VIEYSKKDEFQGEGSNIINECLEQQRQKHISDIAKLQQTHAEDIKKLKEDHLQEVEQIRQQHRLQLEETKAKIWVNLFACRFPLVCTAVWFSFLHLHFSLKRSSFNLLQITNHY